MKLTLGEMRSSGVRCLLVYCADYKCSHAVRITADRWPDGVRLSDTFRLSGLRPRGADIRPDFDSMKCIRVTDKDAFDLWWEWAEKPVDSFLMIDAVINEAVMAQPPDGRRNRAKVNAAVRLIRTQNEAAN